MDARATQAVRGETQPVEAARRIAPLIQQYQDEAERERRLSKPVVHAMGEAGLFRLLTPRSLGGLEVDPITCAHVIEEVAAADSAAAWSVFNPVGWSFLCARLPDHGSEEIFADPHALIVGPFHPPMQAIPTDRGYRVTGRSPFVSNCRDATWIGTTALIMEGATPRMGPGGMPEVIAAMLRATDCEILDTWHVMGMRGTGSDDIRVQDVFVPQSRTFAVAPDFTPGSHYQSPLYRFSMMGLLAAAFAPIVFAMARNAIDEVVNITRNKTPFGSATLLRDRHSTHSKLAQAEASLRSARAWLYETLSDTWRRVQAGEPVSTRQRGDLLLTAVNGVSSAVRAVELMYSLAGTSGIYTKNPLERHFRDLQVLKQHGFVSENRYESVGQIYLGLAPEFGAALL